MAASVLAISSDSDPKSKPADELHERHISLRLHDDMVSRWGDKVISHLSSPSGSSTIPSTEIPIAPISPAPSIEIATASPTCDTLTPIITASPVIRSRIRTTARKNTLGLRPVMTPARSAALRRARRAVLSSETSSSGTSSGSSLDSTSHTSESSFTASLHGTQISPEDHSHHSSKAVRSPSGPPVGGRSAQTMLHLHLLHLLDPLRRDIEVETVVAGTTATATVDGLGIKLDMAVVETSFKPGLAVVVSESKPEEAEADDEADAEI
ncbi:hypothetical protein Tco_0833331 [Tanacetum coccineum]